MSNAMGEHNFQISFQRPFRFFGVDNEKGKKHEYSTVQYSMVIRFI